jgi:hypothetical protein
VPIGCCDKIEEFDMRIQTANQLRGRAVGAMFFACFGTGWIFLGLAAKQFINGGTASGTVSGMMVLLLAAAYLMRRAKSWPRVSKVPARGRAFAWINAIQWTAVAIIAFSFSRLHIDAYTTSAITAIIGLHLFPLARLFQYSMHSATGTVLVGWAVASALLVPVAEMQGTTALGTGTILWTSAAVTLGLALRAAGQPVPAQAIA